MKKVRISLVATILLGIIYVFSSGQSGCEPACGALNTPEVWPQSGYYGRFVAVDEYFHVWIDSPGGIAHIDEWLAGTPSAETLGIPGAPIELDGAFNPGYSYRLEPESVEFGEVWMEVCDGTPCYVEADPAGWFANPTTWCPWGAFVHILWDCTGSDGLSCGEPVFVAGM
ncbi:hypothetical protein ACFL4G_11120 [Thermodesulfobacteriota bacterium]